MDVHRPGGKADSVGMMLVRASHKFRAPDEWTSDTGNDGSLAEKRRIN